MSAAVTLAVVIPALDEADRVGAAVASALDRAPATGGARASTRRSPAPDEERRSAPGRGPDHDGDADRSAAVDVVVVDGGSRDDTAGVARRAGARVIASPPGRGRQLDCGWRATKAEAVLFLHADTVLPAGWRAAVTDALQDAAVSGGAFRFGLAERGAVWRLIEWGVAVRVSLFGLPYGDQAIFVRRSVLEASGGVPDVAILEDLDLVRAIKRAGRLRVLPGRVRTSARRHRGRVVATVSRHALGLAGFFLGVDRRWLARRVRG